MLQKVFGNREMFYNQLMPSQLALSTDFNGNTGSHYFVIFGHIWHRKVAYYVRVALKKMPLSTREMQKSLKALLFLLPTLLKIHSQCPGHHIHILPEARLPLLHFSRKPVQICLYYGEFGMCFSNNSRALEKKRVSTFFSDGALGEMWVSGLLMHQIPSSIREGFPWST